jgi:adhesin/invasin
LAYAQNPSIPTRNPHIFSTSIDIPSLAAAATGAQEQLATFFETDGARIIHPAPADLFEVPIKLPLAENLEYVTAGQPVQPPLDSAIYQTALSPGSLFTIFGQTNSVGGEQSAGSGNLPTTLGGVMVSINGKPAPLLYVGPNQINGQVPYETATTGAIAQVIANGISAAQVPFVVSPVAPKLFIGQGNICIAQNEDGTLNSASNPVRAGHYVGAYLIGLGAVNPSVATGAPARPVPLSMPPGPVSASLGGRSLSPTYLGLIPGYVGVGEVDLLVPSDMTGGLLNFAVTVGNATSNTCQIAVGK